MAMDLAQLVRALSEQSTPDTDGGPLRLPTERALVDSLEISRGALREQLSVLEHLGFLDRTQGRGSYLTAPDTGFLQLYFDLAGQLGHLSQPQFRDAREILETALAEAAARRATADDVDALRALVDEMVRATTAGEHRAALEADLDFHRQLCEIVGNPVFSMLHDALSHALRSELVERRELAGQVPLPPGRSLVIDTVHYGIVEAIDGRDAEGARAAMRRHFEVWSSFTDASAHEAVRPCTASDH
ncbi:FadR/GntR family transcriptional regulator [Streptomyces sp. NPDC002666]